MSGAKSSSVVSGAGVKYIAVMEPRVFAARRRRFRHLLHRRGIRHFLVSSLPNVRYLCGFTGSNGALLLTPNEVIFVSDGRYTGQARAEVSGCRIVIVEQGSFSAGIVRVIEASKSRRLGFEPQAVSVLLHRRLAHQLRGRVRLHAWEGLVESLRMVKDRREIENVGKAARIADRAFRRFLPELRVGITERDAQWRLLGILRDLGSERSPFEPIVLFGPRSSLPHGRPEGRRLRRGDWVMMDFGAVVDGYCSDFTRTVVKGSASPEMAKVYAVVRKAQKAGVRAVWPGVRARDVDAAARAAIEQAGYGEEFSHGLGHGVGLEVHEGPRVGKTSKDVLRAGMLTTIEPGIYIPDWGGIRIEDTVLVTGQGGQRLTRSSRALIVV